MQSYTKACFSSYHDALSYFHYYPSSFSITATPQPSPSILLVFLHTHLPRLLSYTFSSDSLLFYLFTFAFFSLSLFIICVTFPRFFLSNSTKFINARILIKYFILNILFLQVEEPDPLFFLPLPYIF